MKINIWVAGASADGTGRFIEHALPETERELDYLTNGVPHPVHIYNDEGEYMLGVERDAVGGYALCKIGGGKRVDVRNYEELKSLLSNPAVVLL